MSTSTPSAPTWCFQAEGGIRVLIVTGVQTCALSISSRRRHTRSDRDWSSDVCSSDLADIGAPLIAAFRLWLESRPDEEHWELIAGVPTRKAPASKACRRIASNVEWLLNEIGRASCRERV